MKYIGHRSGAGQPLLAWGRPWETNHARVLVGDLLERWQTDGETGLVLRPAPSTQFAGAGPPRGSPCQGHSWSRAPGEAHGRSIRCHQQAVMGC